LSPNFPSHISPEHHQGQQAMLTITGINVVGPKSVPPIYPSLCELFVWTHYMGMPCSLL